jgi:hypothetical protein
MRPLFCIERTRSIEKFVRLRASNVKIVRATKPYFIECFLISKKCAHRANTVAVKKFLCALLTRMMRVPSPNARCIHASLSRTLFFSLCCSKRNAVRVDSRRALMRHPP